MDKVVLSLGWTTYWNKDSKEGYTKQYMDAMETIFKEHKLNTTDYKDISVNFPIRAPYALKSQDVLKSFYNNMTKTNTVTFTVQSQKGDIVDANELKKFIESYGIEKIYIDLHDELREKLNLSSGKGNGASTIVQFGLLNLITMLVVTILRN